MFERLGAVALLLALLAGCSGQPVKDGDAYVRAGQQPPVVFLQSGLGDGKDTWNKLIPDLARDHTVFAYDRPGYGAARPTDGPRDPCTIAQEAHALLGSKGAPPPYILVGHSLGGLYQYAFAKLYPDEVAGLVLVDPTHPRHWETMQRQAPTQAAMLKALRLAFSTSERREFDDQAGCLDRLALDQPLQVPTRILVAGRLRPEEKGNYETMLDGLRRDWLRLTGAPRLERVLDASHYIQEDNPRAVLAAVRDLSGKSATALATPQALDDAGITPGVTRRAQVREHLGEAAETIRDPETGDEVWVYTSTWQVPWYVSFVPVLGDVADLVETTQELGSKQERLIRFDAQGVVRASEVRPIGN